MNIRILILSFFLLIIFSNAQLREDWIVTKYVKTENRIKQRKEFLSQVNYLVSRPINNISDSLWFHITNEILLKQYDKNIIKNYLTHNLFAKNNSDKKRIQILTLCYSLFPKDFTKEVFKIFEITNNERLFTISILYLNRISFNKLNPNYYLSILEKRFPKWRSNDFLTDFYYDLLDKDNYFDPVEILKYDFQKERIIVYTFLRKDRRFAGLTVIKNQKGKFLKEKDDYFYVKQLALSSTGLPSYFKNGNAPTGIYSIEGFYVSPTKSIGPTPILTTRLPFEISASRFYKDEKINKYSIEKYLNLLPKSMKKNRVMLSSYKAGKSGRKKIIMHGSADDLSYYEQKDYYPLTPSLGCLTTIEIWNENSGKPRRSDQLKLVKKYNSIGSGKGFLVVIELDDKKRDIEISDIKEFLSEAEKN